MVRKEISLIAQEEKALKDLCVFEIYIYIKAWSTAPEAIEAPCRDLASLKSLSRFFFFLPHFKSCLSICSNCLKR